MGEVRGRVKAEIVRWLVLLAWMLGAVLLAYLVVTVGVAE